jgi:hypothetical protein
MRTGSASRLIGKAQIDLFVATDEFLPCAPSRWRKESSDLKTKEIFEDIGFMVFRRRSAASYKSNGAPRWQLDVTQGACDQGAEGHALSQLLRGQAAIGGAPLRI